LAVVQVFDTGALPQFRPLQAAFEASIVTLRDLAIDQEP
jgi:hypothetical protein